MTATIQQQLAWEEEMVQHGVERFRAQQDSAVEGGRTEDTSAGSRLMRNYVLQISDQISLYLAGKHPEGRRRGKYAKLLATLNPDKSAMLALKAVIATLFNPISLQSLCISVGKVVEDDLRLMRFQENYKEYYDDIVRNFEARNSTDYRYQRRALLHGEGKQEDLKPWVAWTNEDHFGVGSLVLSLLLEVCDLVEKKTISKARNRKEVLLVPTEDCIDWVLRHNEAMEIASPDRMPCLVQPDDWTGLNSGGYYSPAVRSRTPFIKIRHGSTLDHRMAMYNKADLSKVYSAVNAMQRTGWQINEDVMRTMQKVWHTNSGIGMPRSQPYEIPPAPLDKEDDPRTFEEDDPRRVAFVEWKATAREIHTLERDRVAKNLALMRTMRIANTMKEHDEFFYVYQCDFRGRMYSATAGLSPQGTDHAKSLIRFSEGKPLGDEGWYWLKVHGANKYGYDKEDFDDRVAWIKEGHTKWCLVAEDPILHTDYWKDADKPYQFLAFCFEYAAAVGQHKDFVSHLPVAMDGSCNGLQHFSAMLRDPVGGAAVNLVPSDKPQDIYQRVADVCTRKLVGLRSGNDNRHGGAVNWLALFRDIGGKEAMPRKLSKTPVMTMPYGSTRQACTETIFKWNTETAPDYFEKGTSFRHSMYLSPLMWDSIGEVVVAARAAMDWIQDCAGILAKAGHPLEYTSPLGFPVYQEAFTYKTRCIETQISGRMQLRFAEPTNKLSSRDQRQGSSPNFVHQADGCHEQMCVNACVEVGVTSFAMIHDDFGTHACDIPKLHTAIRETFVELHSIDLLGEFKRVHEERHEVELPPAPPRGSLDLSVVLQSKFMFG